MFYIDFPEDFANAIHAAKDKAAARQVGIEWCIAQSKELKKRGAPILHYYTMGDTNTMLKILKEVA